MKCFEAVIAAVAYWSISCFWTAQTQFGVEKGRERRAYSSGRIRCLNDMATVWSEPSHRSDEMRTKYLIGAYADVYLCCKALPGVVLRHASGDGRENCGSCLDSKE
jgi:hypothetical protein